MVALSPLAGAGWQFFDNNGVKLSGGKLYTYAAGTTTPAVTYTSKSGATPHANPIILDSAGRVSSEIWLVAANNYKFVLATANDVILWTKDDIAGIATSAELEAFIASLASSTGASLVGADDSSGGSIFTTVQGFINKVLLWTQTGTGAIARALWSKANDTISVKDFGVTGGGSSEVTAFQNAINAASAAKLPLDGQGLTIRLDATAGQISIPTTGLELINCTLDLSHIASNIVPFVTAGALGSAILTTANVTRYDTTVTLASTTGLAVGDYLILTSTDKWSTADSVNKAEWVSIKSINTGTGVVTLYAGTQDAYTTANGACVYKPTLVEYVRMRNVTIIGGGVGLAQNGPKFSLCKSVVLENCNSRGFASRAWQTERCIKVDVNGGTVQDGDDTTGLSYGHVVAGPTVSVEYRNIVGRRLRHVVTAGGTTGVVRGYLTDNIVGEEMTDATVDAHASVDDATILNTKHYPDLSVAIPDGDGIVSQARKTLIRGVYFLRTGRHGVLVQPLCSAYTSSIEVYSVYGRAWGYYGASSCFAVVIDLSVANTTNCDRVAIDGLDIESAEAAAGGIYITNKDIDVKFVSIGPNNRVLTALSPCRVANIDAGAKVIKSVTMTGGYYERSNITAENIYVSAAAANGIGRFIASNVTTESGQYSMRGLNIAEWNVSNNALKNAGAGALLGISDAGATRIAKNNIT